MISRHFDFLYNDDCHIGDKTIITVLGGWQVSSEVVLWWSCPSLHPVGGMGQHVVIHWHGREDWRRSHQPLPCQMEIITRSSGDLKAGLKTLPA